MTGGPYLGDGENGYIQLPLSFSHHCRRVRSIARCSLYFTHVHECWKATDSLLDIRVSNDAAWQLSGFDLCACVNNGFAHVH